MGMQNQLKDISSESIPVLFLTIVATCVCYLQSVILSVVAIFGFASAKLNPPSSYWIDSAMCDAVGSGLAGVLMLSEQLNLNRNLSYRFDEDGSGSVCVVCLNRLIEGDHVRKLACCHVFHKQCFDGWLNQLSFNCPLCRSPEVAEESVVTTRHRIAEDLCEWFSFR